MAVKDKAEAEAVSLANSSIPETPSPSKIPRTTLSRLEQSPADGSATPELDTVLYLAFGSNLCAETFLGKRKIQPLSSINVTAPSLRLTFSIPGLPYLEPCFANTAPRKIPKEPLLPDPQNPAPVVPPPIADPDGPPTWDKGLVGVVYEVTKEDYARILATEGGGSSYHEIVVPCLAIPPRMQVPENPGGVIPKPFLARTLCMPILPEIPTKPEESKMSDGEDSGDGDDDKNKKRKGWWWWLTRNRQRPDPEYAEPSLRYLNLIRTGAAEHELPDEYQAYLAALHSYTVTRTSQKMARLAMAIMWGPAIIVIFSLGSMLADKESGRVPTWYAGVMTGMFNCVWWSYDVVFKRVFGDGERTMERDEEERAWWVFGRREGRIRLCAGDEGRS